jgi:hypothetical protein
VTGGYDRAVATLPDEAATVAQAGRDLLAVADRVHAAVVRAQSVLDRSGYECAAARRHRDRLAELEGRVHHHGSAMTEAGLTLLRHAASL